MNTHAYQLGFQARKKNAWFETIRGYYLAEGMLTNDVPTLLAFYEGYWGESFNVHYDNGRFTMTNKDRSAVSRI
jgi:hypothetical protein